MLASFGFNRLIYGSTGAGTPATSSGPPSEAQSEISSVDSDWSDIRAIANKLGVQNPDDLHTERFKVDRQKLENMIKTESIVEGFVNSAEIFFENVMKNSSVCISWPCRLKIGAKSKKDPHVRIVGKPEDVHKAKECVLASLDSRGTRVIMKMDVSYTDHSYIIGRGGNNIKRIMESTKTHIHFPDSNRSNPTEKSNQVSLCGSMEGVEKARSLVRLSTPLLISFELPVLAPGRPAPDHDTPFITNVENQYNVQVIFSTRPKLHSSLVLVKGSEKEAAKVQEATQELINFTCENIANQILVHMQLEISPQHHEVVKGKHNTNLLSIMERTRTKIIFPDLSDMNIKAIKRSQVTITGTIDGVYKARQQLIGNLPVALIFDFPDSNNDASDIISLSTKYGVFITLRQKQRQSTLAVVIKGIEKYIDKVYEARQEILKLTTLLVKPEIPKTYFSPHDSDVENVQKHNLTALLSNQSIEISPVTPSMLSYQNQQPQHFQGTPTGICPPTQKYLQVHNSFHNSRNNQNQINNNNSYLQVPMQHQQQQHQVLSQTGQNMNNNNNVNVSPRNSIHNTSGYQSFSSSTTSLEQSYAPYHAGNKNSSNVASATSLSSSSIGRSHYSPDSTYGSNSCSRGRRLSDGGGGGLHMHNSSNEYRNYDVKSQQRAFDFDMKRVIGFKAMECAPQGEARTPTANWVGLGLSRTSPAPLESVTPTNEDLISWNRTTAALTGAQQSSPYNLSSTTGLIDSTPSNRRLQMTQHKDIHSLLTSLGLEHYIKTFVMNEVDLDMFTTLTEENLLELGIKAFGARKKLMVGIHTLQANEAINNVMTSPSNASPRFSGSAAPGAERRTSNGW
ncbi:BICC1 family protein [Megaselia abdita]